MKNNIEIFITQTCLSIILVSHLKIFSVNNNFSNLFSHILIKENSMPCNNPKNFHLTCNDTLYPTKKNRIVIRQYSNVLFLACLLTKKKLQWMGRGGKIKLCACKQLLNFSVKSLQKLYVKYLLIWSIIVAQGMVGLCHTGLGLYKLR